MLFLISFFWFVVASFAFVLAILFPNWAQIQTKTGNQTVQRGIFFSCELLGKNETFEHTVCLPLIQQTKSIEPHKWTYEYAIATASIAIGCAGLSLIVICLSAVYFRIIQRTKSNLSFLFLLSLIVLLTTSASIVVWVLIIVESARLGQKVDRDIFRWPIWLAVGSTGGYLISFLLILISACRTARHRRIVKNHYYQHGEHF